MFLPHQSNRHDICCFFYTGSAGMRVVALEKMEHVAKMKGQDDYEEGSWGLLLAD